MNEIKLTINGIEVGVNKGATVLESAQQAGIYIPTLCSDPDLVASLLKSPGSLSCGTQE